MIRSSRLSATRRASRAIRMSWLTRSKNFSRSMSTTMVRPSATYRLAWARASCAPRPGRKPIAGCREGRVQERFQHLQNGLLHEAVDDRRDAQLPHPASRLGDLHPTHRLWFIRPVEQRGQRIPACARRSRSAVRRWSCHPRPALPCWPSPVDTLGSGSRVDTSSISRSVKARAGSNAVDVCCSSHAPGPVPPSPRVVVAQTLLKLLGRGAVGKACLAAAPHPSSRLRLTPWQERFGPSFALARHGWTSPVSAFGRHWTSELLRPLLTSPVPFPRRCRRGSPVRPDRPGRSPRVSCASFPRRFAGSTCVRVRMTFGRLRPLPDYPTTPALYPVSVRRVRVLASASFRFRLAADTLA